MEKMLQKMARQLNSMDEASLTSLWNKYHQRVREFDASTEWEEATLILSLIQAVAFKNQLFNTQWAELHPESVPSSGKVHNPDILSPWNRFGSSGKKQEKTSATIHTFRPRQQD